MPNIKRGMMGAAGAVGGVPSTQELWVWGEAPTATGVVSSLSSPVQVGTDLWTDACARRNGGLGISDGKLFSWGKASNAGLIGDGVVIGRSSPVQIGTATNWASVSGSDFNSLAITTDYKMYSWGKGDDGLIGDGTSGIDRSSPVQIGAGTDWLFSYCGYKASAAITTGGKLYTWGSNVWEGLGHDEGTTEHKSVPVQVGSGTGWTYVSTPGDLGPTMGIQSGKLYVIGGNWGYMIPDSANVKRSAPLQIGALEDWTNCSTISRGGSAISGGKLMVWGSAGDYWHLGSDTRGLGAISTKYSSPVQVGSATNWVQAGGDRFQHAINSDGELWAIGGQGNFGSAALGTTTNQSVPIQVGSLTTWTKVRATFKATIGLKTPT